ncbi:MAG: alpha/beta hydrolase [Oscillospiraceae bacterium]
MALSKIQKAALSAASSARLDIKNNYKLHRVFIKALHTHLLRPAHRIWENHSVKNGDYDVPLRIFSPKLKGYYPAIIFFHGGGWVTGDLDSYDKVCTQLSEETMHTVVSVEYRLAPEYKFPIALEDCYAVVREVFMKSPLINVDKSDITLMGDSAGANLAACVSLLARDRKEFLPPRQILLYPVTNNDHSETSRFDSVVTNGTDYLLTRQAICDYLELYKSCDDDINSPYFAPLLAELDNQPKTLIITAEFDPLRDEGEAFGERLREFNNDVSVIRIPDALHGFFSRPKSFESVKTAYKHINEFLKEVPHIDEQK